MRLYLLTRTDGPTYDAYEAKLIRAKSQKQAREIANIDTGDEGEIWVDKKQVKSTILKNKGRVGEIITSFNAA